MIDTKELRRLAQEATPHVGHACKYQDAHWLREGHVDFENADLFIASERPQEDAAFYAAANPAAITEILDRLKAAEKERVIDEQRIADLMADLNRVGRENEELRARIEAMERQEPVGWLRLYEDGSSSEDFTDSPHVFERQRPLYALPGAQGE